MTKVSVYQDFKNLRDCVLKYKEMGLNESFAICLNNMEVLLEKARTSENLEIKNVVYPYLKELKNQINGLIELVEEENND